MAEKIRVEFEGDAAKFWKEFQDEARKAGGGPGAPPPGVPSGGGKPAGSKFGKQFKSGVKDSLKGFAIGSLVTGGVVGGLALLNKGLDAMLAKETALADFSAITGVTGDELAEFGDIATELSNQFGTSTVDNIESFKGILSRLGPDIAKSSEAVRLMGENVNILSKASGLDATASMDALTTAMLQFGVDLSDPIAAAEEMTAMMNVMAAGAKEGAAEVPQIAAALVQVGATAKSLNVSFEETNALIQTLAKVGKFGSAAGIGLRNVLISLTKATGPGNEALKKLGLTTEQLASVLTSGGPNSANDALTLLNDALAEVPDLGEQATLKVDIFGRENLAAAGGVLDLADATNELTDSMTDTETAFEQARINMGTTQEQMKRLREQGLNELVDAFEVTLEGAGDLFVSLTGFIGKAADEMRLLMELDFAGFWDIAFVSVSDYNTQLQEQIALEDELFARQRRKLISDKERSDKRVQLFALEETLNKKLIETEKLGATERGKLISKFEQLFNEGQVSNLDEFFLLRANNWRTAAEVTSDSITALKDAAEEAAKPIAGSFGAMTVELKEINNQLLNRLVPGSEAFLMASEKALILRREIKGIKEDVEAANRSIEFFLDVAAGKFDIDVDAPQAFDVEANVQQVGGFGITSEIDATTSALDDLLSKMGELGNAGEFFGQAFGDSMSAGLALIGESGEAAGEGMKQLMKTVANAAITGAEALLFAGEAAAFAKAVGSFGITLIADQPLIAAGFFALETGRAIINSLAVGGVVKQDQLIMAHAKETVIPFREAPAFFAEAVNQGAGTGARSSQRKKYQEPERVIATGQSVVMRDSTFRSLQNRADLQATRNGR